jgi:hypothetical protein
MIIYNEKVNLTPLEPFGLQIKTSKANEFTSDFRRRKPYEFGLSQQQLLLQVSRISTLGSGVSFDADLRSSKPSPSGVDSKSTKFLQRKFAVCPKKRRARTDRINTEGVYGANTEDDV